MAKTALPLIGPDRRFGHVSLAAEVLCGCETLHICRAMARYRRSLLPHLTVKGGRPATPWGSSQAVRWSISASGGATPVRRRSDGLEPALQGGHGREQVVAAGPH